MSNFFYRINETSAVHVARLSAIDSINSFWYHASGDIYSGNSQYYYMAGTTGASGSFPIIGSTTYSSAYASHYVRQASISLSASSVSIFTAQLKSLWDSFVGNSTQITITSFPTTIDFCDSTGSLLGMNLNITASTSNPLSITLGFDKYSGKFGFNPYAVGSFYASGTTVKIAFFQINSYIGFAAYVTGASNSTAYDRSSFCLAYQSLDDYSPISALLANNSALYGSAAGSTDIDPSIASAPASSGGIGGDGIYEFPSTDIDVADDMPSSSPAISAGFINPYYVTASEIATLGNFLWSSDFFDSIAKTFSNPMDCIISLSSFPLASSSMSLGSSESVRVGNTTSSSTGTRLISEFVTIDCGSISVPEVWGSYLDYAQTKLYIYIPYLGIEELPLCECMGGTVACSLRINLLTGALVACVTLTSGTYVTGSARVQPIYFSTTCKSDIPVSGATTGALAGAFQLLGGATSAIAGVATGTAPLAISGLASAAQGVATMQSQNSQISGAVGAAGGQMAHKIPFLIFDHPVQSVPANLASVAGYRSNSGTTLSRCSGYVICDTINLDGLALTRSELEEVEQICTSGVYIS